MSTHDATPSNTTTTLIQIIIEIIIQITNHTRPVHTASLHDTSPLLSCLLLSRLLLDLLHASKRAIVPPTVRAALNLHLFNTGSSCAIVLAAALVRCEVGEETTT